MKHYTFVDYATQTYMALVGVVVLVFHNQTVPHWAWLVGAHFGCLFLIHGLIRWDHQTAASPKPPKSCGPKVLSFLRHFYPVLLYTWFFSETGWLNRMFFSDYLDPIVIRWDQALFGCQPGAAFMEALPYLAVSELFYASYFSYYVMIAGVGVALFVRDRRQFFHYLSVVSFVFYVCYALYIVFPVIGPRVLFREIAGYSLPPELDQLVTSKTYPEAIKSGVFYHIMRWIYDVFEAPGAAIPSSHVAIALCTVFFSFRYLPRIRFLHLVVALCLCGSTVYCRYHYAVDVLAGMATAATLVPLGNWLYFKFARHVPPVSGNSSPHAPTDGS